MNEKHIRQIGSKLGIRFTGEVKGWLMAPCPLAKWRHQHGTDKDPSFGVLVNPEGFSYYHCFSCKSRGRMSSLVRSLEHYRNDAKLGTLALEADRADLDITYPDFETSNAMASMRVIEPLSEDIYADMYPSALNYPEAIAYLATRGAGITEDTIEALDIRYDPDEQRIVLLVRNSDGGLFGFTGRTILDESEYPYGRYPRIRDYAGLPKEHLLLGADRIDYNLPILVVEGLMGYVSLVNEGVESIVNVICMLGSEMTVSKADLICGWNLPTYLMPDNDEAGDACLFGTLHPVSKTHSGGGAIDKLKGHVPLFLPEWPEGTYDPDELTFEDVRHLLATTKMYV